MRDTGSIVLLGRETKMDDLTEQLAEKIAVYKKEGVATNALIAQISAEKDVKMATLQDVQNILRELGIFKVDYTASQDKPSEVLIF